jgi:hypothetical protein
MPSPVTYHQSPITAFRVSFFGFRNTSHQSPVTNHRFSLFHFRFSVSLRSAKEGGTQHSYSWLCGWKSSANRSTSAQAGVPVLLGAEPGGSIGLAEGVVAGGQIFAGHIHPAGGRRTLFPQQLVAGQGLAFGVGEAALAQPMQNQAARMAAKQRIAGFQPAPLWPGAMPARSLCRTRPPGWRRNNVSPASSRPRSGPARCHRAAYAEPGRQDGGDTTALYRRLPAGPALTRRDATAQPMQNQAARMAAIQPPCIAGFQPASLWPGAMPAHSLCRTRPPGWRRNNVSPASSRPRSDRRCGA